MTSGLLDLPWWGLIIATVVMAHITVMAVTLYLHRDQTHRGIDLHPVISHFYRFWLWLTSGMVITPCNQCDARSKTQVGRIN